MLHPSYSDLMNVVNSNVEEGEEPVVNSRYSIVMATAKRARQIIAGDMPLVEEKDGNYTVKDVQKDMIYLIRGEWGNGWVEFGFDVG